MQTDEIKNNVKRVKEYSFRSAVILLPGGMLLANYYMLSAFFFIIFLILYVYTATFDKCKKYKECKKNIFKMHLLSIVCFLVLIASPSSRIMIAFLWIAASYFIQNRIDKYDGV